MGINLAWRSIMSHQFAPVIVANGSGLCRVSDADGAAEFLSKKWPAFRGPLHADATASTMLALHGKATSLEARDAFVAAAREADILIEGYIVD
jgi:hypothetical protein